MGRFVCPVLKGCIALYNFSDCKLYIMYDLVVIVTELPVIVSVFWDRPFFFFHLESHESCSFMTDNVDLFQHYFLTA